MRVEKFTKMSHFCDEEYAGEMFRVPRAQIKDLDQKLQNILFLNYGQPLIKSPSVTDHCTFQSRQNCKNIYKFNS